MSDSNWTRTIVRALVALVLCAAIWAIVFPMFTRAREGSYCFTSLGNVKQQARGLILYREDYDRTHPPSRAWMDAILPFGVYDETVFKDPALKSKLKEEFGFAFFRLLSGMKVDELRNPHLIPMTFQSRDLSWNASGGLDLLPYRRVKPRGNHVSFVDGHAKYVLDSWRHETIVIELPE